MIDAVISLRSIHCIKSGCGQWCVCVYIRIYINTHYKKDVEVSCPKKGKKSGDGSRAQVLGEAAQGTGVV